MTKQYSFLQSTLLANQINILLLNYEGSLGYGNQAVKSLLKNVGKKDVTDCIDLINLACAKYSEFIKENDLIVYGGSHGGFLTAHLI